MLTITHYQGHANQNSNEIPSHSSEKGMCQRLETITANGIMMKRTFHSLLVGVPGMVVGVSCQILD